MHGATDFSTAEMCHNPLMNAAALWEDKASPALLTLALAAGIAAGAFLQVPFGPVPFSMQTFFVLLAGFVLGPVRGGLAAVLYLAAGLAGLPVFAGATAGPAKLLGPTGGFLAAFLPAAVLAGFAARHPGRLQWRHGLLWGTLASLVIFGLGVPWLKAGLDMSWSRAFRAGVLPFLPGAIVKLLFAVVVARWLHDAR